MSDTIIATGYRSYLVRFWQSTEQGSWRASAQCVQSGNTVLFGDIESLLAFLQTEIEYHSPPSYVSGPLDVHLSSPQEKPK